MWRGEVWCGAVGVCSRTGRDETRGMLADARRPGRAAARATRSLLSRLSWVELGITAAAARIAAPPITARLPPSRHPVIPLTPSHRSPHPGST